MIDATRTLPFRTAGCVGARIHKPKPLISELHHVFPVYLQQRIWPDVDPTRPGTAHVKEFATLCGNCHATVHVVLTALLTASVPPKAPRKLVAIARQGWQMFKDAGGS